ncbi:hypothetical protein LX32DRAFT_184286 [Colletotrichum zoysiae]|uniref:Uncharacterized protein n=1 Tax=Colletotrichum zoysiae TaxID=1216348 RepID=A0AAD9H7G0_9PEZI|nr:hypothetical protein LX32DRAFT_184286 [Colletotrichum zoysiae]
MEGGWGRLTQLVWCRLVSRHGRKRHHFNLLALTVTSQSRPCRRMAVLGHFTQVRIYSVRTTRQLGGLARTQL